MHVYHASVSADNPTNHSRERVLIVALNWLGDSIMSMPAIQAYRRAFPAKRLTILIKPAMVDLWSMHPAIDDIWVCLESIPQIWKTASQINQRHFSTAYILPQSFRSALIPFLGKVPQRIGLRGHFRSCLLTNIVSLPQNAASLHQQFEYMPILGQKTTRDELPVLNINTALLAKTDKILGHNRKQAWIGLIPGAARGPAKRWPENYFTAVGKILIKNFKCNIVLFGSTADKELCTRIKMGIGNDVFPASTNPSPVENHAEDVINLAGRTSLPELAALMSRCSAVIGNDSGGVHLAAAVGTAVIVIFGITNPAKRKPLGQKVVVLQDSPLADRNVPRQSVTAEKSLKNISPEMAVEAIQSFL